MAGAESLSVFLSWVSKTQPNHWTKRMAIMFWKNSHFQWLFFQNAIQLQPYGGKNHIVLYQEMWLQSRLHVSKLLSAATSQRFKWSGPRPGT